METPTAAVTDETAGHAIMVSRLFSRIPESVTYTVANQPASGSVYNFMTASDRTVIASLYDYAQQNGVALQKVDDLAFDLGGYRMEPAGARPGDFLVGYDESGAAHYGMEYSEAEEATAQRILTSKAIKDSALPEDFLRYKLAGAGHASDFTFLEEVVYATSVAGSDGATDPTATLAPRPKERFAAMQAAGLILSPEQARELWNPKPPTAESSFDNFASRVQKSVPFLTDEDKKSFGALYASAAEKYGPNSPQMKDVDRMVRSVAALRLSGLTSAGGSDAVSDGPSLLDLLKVDKNRSWAESYRPLATVDVRA